MSLLFLAVCLAPSLATEAWDKREKLFNPFRSRGASLEESAALFEDDTPAAPLYFRRERQFVDQPAAIDPIGQGSEPVVQVKELPPLSEVAKRLAFQPLTPTGRTLYPPRGYPTQRFRLEDAIVTPDTPRSVKRMVHRPEQLNPRVAPPTFPTVHLNSGPGVSVTDRPLRLESSRSFQRIRFLPRPTVPSAPAVAVPTEDPRPAPTIVRRLRPNLSRGHLTTARPSTERPTFRR